MKDKQRPDGYDKLPARFKSYISDLESRIYSLESRQPVDGETRVKIVDRMAQSTKQREVYLRDQTEVAFRPGKDWIEARISEGLRGAVVELHGHWGGLAVYPSSSNVVHVMEADYAEYWAQRRKKS